MKLVKIEPDEAPQLLAAYGKIYAPFLVKYHDDSINPGKKSLDWLKKRMADDFRTHYWIVSNATATSRFSDVASIDIRGVAENDRIVGTVEIIKVTWEFAGQEKIHIDNLGIFPEFQNQGLAQAAFAEMERLFSPNDGWELSTILQEKRNLHLYEKLGYERTGSQKVINDAMTIVGFRKK